MEDLTGRTFTKVDLDENGAPTHPTLLLHVPYAQDEKNPETAASRLLTSIIDNDPEAQAILFYDSRQGGRKNRQHGPPSPSNRGLPGRISARRKEPDRG